MEPFKYTSPRPTLDQAISIVVEEHDSWGCDDCESTKDIVRYVTSVLRLPEAPAVPGTHPLEETDDPISHAFRVVLEEVK